MKLWREMVDARSVSDRLSRVHTIVHTCKAGLATFQRSFSHIVQKLPRLFCTIIL